MKRLTENIVLELLVLVLQLNNSAKEETEVQRPRVSKELVRELLEGLDVFKSAGLDDLHPRVLRELAKVIAGPLAWLYKHLWCSGVVPEDWKRANVVPIFKIRWKEDPGNYRPVSLTSILGKLFERIILAHVHKGPAWKVLLRGNQHRLI